MSDHPLDDLDEDIREHIERAAAEHAASGMPIDEARRRARVEFGSVARAREDARGVWVRRWLDELRQDLRYALRGLRRHPGFAASIILTLALGIGANTVVFSVVDGVVLNPFPFPQSDRLVGVGSAYPRLNRDLTFWENLSPAEYLDIASESRALQRIVAWDMGNRQIAELGSQNVFSAFWWGDAFPTLDVRPVAGRGFTPDEIARGDRVAVISHRLWQSGFGGDPSMLGTDIHVNGAPYTVVGVMPPRALVYGTDLWIPMPAGPEQYPRQRRQFEIMARLAPGATLAAANRELAMIAGRVDTAYRGQFAEYEDWQLVALPWTDVNVRTLRPAALLLLGAAAFVLLMVCANLANMLLARLTSRRHELAVRAALGAGRARLARQLLIESALLAVLGGAAGLLVAAPAVRALDAMLMQLPVPVPGNVAINARVLAYTLGLSMLFAVLAGAAPVVHIIRGKLQDALKGDERGTTAAPNRLRLQRALVAVQVALAVLLLAGGGLLVRSFVHLRDVNPGFEAGRLLTMRLTLPAARYEGSQRGAFFEEAVRRIAALPGVVSAAAASQIPPGVFSQSQIEAEGAAPTAADTLPAAFTTIASVGYFRALRLPLVQGRLFDADRESTTRVVLLNDVAGRRLFGDADPVGRRLRRRGDPEWLEVVGVVGAARNLGLEQLPGPEIFVPLEQHPAASNQLFLVVRAATDPKGLIGAVRVAIATIDPGQAVYAIQTMDEAFDLAAGPRRMATVALAVFALFALALAAVGVYGVVAYGVVQRRQEIGVRMALGASASQIRSMVVMRSLAPVVAGLVVGLVAALGLSRLMSRLLFEVSGRDPLTLTVAAATMIAAALVASYLPARRASTVDPLIGLKTE